MAFTEFYCQAGGSNLNAGSDTNNAAKYTCVNSNWNTTTSVFTPTDGSNPASAGAVAGDWATVYLDGVTTIAFLARVTAVTNAANGPITLSSTARGGSAPGTGATGRTIKIGGAWKGPTGSVAWPFAAFNYNAIRNVNNDYPRVNMKNDAVYSVTAALNPAGGPLRIQGYSTTPGDLGKAIIDGGTANINVISALSGDIHFFDLEVRNNSGTGNGQNHGIYLDINSSCTRCVVHDVRGNGFHQGNSAPKLTECEAYACNKSNTLNQGGFFLTSQASCLYCISHDNVGSNNNGFVSNPSSGEMRFENCIADSNGLHGFFLGTAVPGFSLHFINCDTYNNGGDGLRNALTTGTNNGYWLIRNCNFIKNGGWGINSNLTTGKWWGEIRSCGFGAGTQANGGGTVNNIDMVEAINNRFYANDVTPYIDPITGNFELILSDSVSEGRGTFTTTQSGFGPTVGYPDIGAAAANAKPFHGWAGSGILPAGYLEMPYLWQAFYQVDLGVISVSAGTLPPGLILTRPDVRSYAISGIPTAIGTYVFVIRHTFGGSYVEVQFEIPVLEGTGGPPPPPPGGGTGAGGGGEETRDVKGSSGIKGGASADDPGAVTDRDKVIKIVYRDEDITNLVKRAQLASSRQENMKIVGANVSKTKEGHFLIGD